MLCACFSEAPQSIQQSLHKSLARAPANSSPAPAGSVFIWTAGVTCRRTARTARMRETVVRYLLPSPGVVKPQQQIRVCFALLFFALVDCIMSPWTAWSACSVSCGLGSLFRQRDILREAIPGGACSGAQFDSRACFPRACPGP